jgi:hypothetical protein
MTPAISENRKLCDLVLKLALELRRPVCSTDLDRHFMIHPESRPVLTQRLGQLLLKAARPAKTEIPRLRQVGLHGNRAYYAPDDDPFWHACFTEYTNREELVHFHQLRYFERVRYLMGSPHDALVRHSLAGWVREAEFLIGRCPRHTISGVLAQQREQMRGVVAPVFGRFIPEDLLTRPAALKHLQRFIRQRGAHRLGFKINYNRYLVELGWPQSHLYPRPPELRYSRRQLEAFMASRWPLVLENEEEAHAVRWALRYPQKGLIPPVCCGD